MAIDAGIYNALSQPRKSAFDYANQFEDQAYQREQRGTQRQMNALQLQQANQAQADDEALRNYLSGGADLNTPEGQAGLYKVAPKAAGGVIKSQLEASDLKAKTRAHEASAKSSEASAAKTQFETEQARRQQHLQELVGVQDVPGAIAWLDAAQASGELPPDRVAMAKQQLQANPQSLGQWKQGAIAGGFTLQQQREQEWKAREFGLKQAQHGETVRHNKAGEGLQAGRLDVSRGNLGVAQANLGVSRDRLALDRSKTAEKHNPQTARVADATDALQLIDQAEKLIDGATGSYVGAGIDQAARVFGASTKGAENAAQLKAVEGILVSKMPKMSGPQSDKDVLLYRQMAGQIGDPTIPAATKKAALKTIRQIQERYAGSQASPTPPTKNPGASGGWSMTRVE